MLFERSSFVGRARELAQIDAVFADGAPLVTVTGCPGAGKTRLAHRYAELFAAELPGGNFFVDLTEARTLADVCTAIARALSIPMPARASSAQLGRELGRAIAARGALLLVLDNAEQVVDDAARAVTELMENAPEASFLVTSRERLRIEGEVCVTLEPLALPQAGQTDAAVLACEAVELFVQRARAAQRTFAASTADAPLLSAVVRKLDGIPLAIELCAARVGVLGLEQLVEALDAPLQVLVTGPRDATGRIATVRGAIDASWLSLATWERQALAQWSVFRGGFDLAAAAAVLELAPGSTDVGPLGILQSLHDKSLLRAYDAPDLSGERRYAMFESIREYAASELELSGAAEATRQRHAAYFVAEGGAWAAAVDRRGGSRALTRLAVETSNVLAAHAWMLSAHRPLEALAAMLSLEPVFSTRGPLARYAELLGSALVAAGVDRAPASVVARAHLARGYALCRAQRVAEGIADLDHAVAIAKQLGDVALIARARSEAGMGRARAGADQVEEDFRCALEALEHVEDEWTRAVVLDNVGAYLQMRGRGDEARARFEAAVAAFRVAGCERGEGRTLGNVAGLCLEAGQLEAAANDFRRALDLLRPFHEKRLEGWVLVGLGAIELELAHLDEARAHLRAAIALNRDTGARQWEALAGTYLGHVELEAGRPATAREHYGDSLALLGELGYERQLGVTRAADSAAAAIMGRLDEAATGFRDAEEILNRAGRPSDALVLALMRRHLDLAGARRDELAGDAGAARSQRDAVRAQLATLDQRALRADEVRFARRTLDSALRACDTAASPIGVAAAEQAPAPWIVRLDGSALQTPSGVRVSLGRRGTLRRLLRKLIEQRLHAPGQALSMQLAIETGWPGQKMDWDAGANRVRVAMSTLRKLGLRSVLVGRDDGYLLDPSAALIAEEDSSPA